MVWWMLLAASAQAGVSQDYVVPSFVCKSWQTEHGLPNNSVTAIAQTPDGYLWVGTENGVVRFDSVRFRSFGLKDGLSSIRVKSLLADHQGTLWVGTYGGLSRWEGNRFQTWTSRDGLADDNVRDLVEDAEGTVWIRSWTGLSRWLQSVSIFQDSLRFVRGQQAQC